MMSGELVKGWRAGILNPLGPDRWEFWKDGVLISRAGQVECVGAAEALLPRYPELEPVELEGVLIPGFVDLHCHWVQHDVRGVYAGELLEWLQNHIWPEEGKYFDQEFSRCQARRFYWDMLRAGTVMGMSFSSVHHQALRAAVKEMHGDWVVGNALMSVNAPEYLTVHSLHAQDRFQQVVATVPRRHYAVTPRFAPNMRREDLAVAGYIAQRNGFLIQTHLAESVAELKWVRELFPEADNYTQVYDQAGLLGQKSILAHCLHMQEEEWACLAARGAWVAHCPSSNEALDNPRMALERVREFQVPWGLGSDIGAGPSHSMLHVLQRVFALHEQAGVVVTAQEALYRATLAGAEAMGRQGETGNLVAGKRADFILMPGNPVESELEGWFRELCKGSILELEDRNLGTWLSGSRVTSDREALTCH